MTTSSSNLWSDIDINLYEDALSLLLEENYFIDNNDLTNATNFHNLDINSNREIKIEDGKEVKKRKYNPNPDVIAQAVDEQLYSLEIDPNSKEGKKKKRQIRNRLSAQFHRDRKNEHIQNLEIQIDNKDKEIEALKNQVNFLISENTSLVLANNQSYLTGLPISQQYSSSSVHSCINYSSSINNTDKDENSSDNGSIDTHSNNNPYQQNFSTVSDSFISPSASPQYSFDESNSVNTQAISPLHAIPRYGTSISVPGLARPLSMITMLCMVSIMLFNQTPVTDINLPLQYQQQQPVFSTSASTNPQSPVIQHNSAIPTVYNKEPEDDVSFISRYLQSLNIWPLAQIQSPLSAIDEVQGENESESNATSMQLSTTSSTSSSISRRLSEVVPSNPVQAVPDSVKVSSIPTLPNVLFPSTTATNSSSSGVTVPLPPVLSRSVSDDKQHVVSSRSPHRNLRSVLPLPINNNNTATTAMPRNIVFSRGVINSTDFTHTSKALSPATTALGTAPTSRLSSQYQQQREPYNWPASASFDYNHNIHHSYSEVILTQGKALLDPSLLINNKNVLPWTAAAAATARGTGRGGYKRNTSPSSNNEAVVAGGALSVMSNPKQPPLLQDTTNLEKALVSSSSLHDKNIIINTPTAISNNPLSTHFLLTSSLPVLPMVNNNNMNHHETIEDNEDVDIDNDEHNNNNIMNFITLQLPASSIRVGKSWSNSQDGTLQSIMEVFNMTISDNMKDTNNTNNINNSDMNHIYSHISSSDASVEISCIIVGAKIIIRDSQQV